MPERAGQPRSQLYVPTLTAWHTRVEMRVALTCSGANVLPDDILEFVIDYSCWENRTQRYFGDLLSAQGILRHTSGILSVTYRDSRPKPGIVCRCDALPSGAIVLFVRGEDMTSFIEDGIPSSKHLVPYVTRSMWDFVCGPGTGHDITESSRELLKEYIEWNPENDIPTGGRIDAEFRNLGITPRKIRYLRAEFRRKLADYCARRECAGVALARVARS